MGQIFSKYQKLYSELFIYRLWCYIVKLRSQLGLLQSIILPLRHTEWRRKKTCFTWWRKVEFTCRLLAGFRWIIGPHFLQLARTKKIKYLFENVAIGRLQRNIVFWLDDTPHSAASVNNYYPTFSALLAAIHIHYPPYNECGLTCTNLFIWKGYIDIPDCRHLRVLIG